MEALRDDRVLMPQAGFVGRLFGINLYESNLAPTSLVDDSGTDKKYQVILSGTTKATTFASRPPVTQVLTPETNQTGPRWALRQVRTYGRMVVDDDRLWATRVRAEA